MVGNKKRLPAPYKKDWDNLFFGYALSDSGCVFNQCEQLLNIVAATGNYARDNLENNNA